MLDHAERLLFLQGQIAARVLPIRIVDLSKAEFRVFSQFGEDGIIEWLVSKIQPSISKFVEFGVESFEEANCRFLMQNRNWQGFVMDADAENIDSLRTKEYHWQSFLKTQSTFVDRDNINKLILDSGFSGPVGVLSIDLDGNDYWIWDALTVSYPDIFVCEYNGLLGDLHPICVPYFPDFERYRWHSSGRYYGASLPALVKLSKRKGYTFVGTTSHGLNAFFVKDDLAPRVMPYIGEIRGYPNRMRVLRDRKGDLAFADSVLELKRAVEHLPVYDIIRREERTIASLGEVYSDEWLKVIGD